MSIHAIEQIFWEFGDDKRRVRRFVEDPDAYLANYALSEAERKMVKAVDVKALDAHGVSSMLILSAWNLVNSGNPLAIFEYLRNMNGGRMVNRMKIPGWQFVFIRSIVASRRAWHTLLRAVGAKGQMG